VNPIYVSAIKQLREHVLSTVDAEKIRLVVFQNGLEESYFPEAWDRMVYYGNTTKGRNDNIISKLYYVKISEEIAALV